MMVRPPQREIRTWVLDSRRWDGFVPRPDDIIIGTAPKCGTTWMQRIVAALVFQDPMPRPIPMVSPWVEARFRGTGAEMQAVIEALPHRRFLKTHLPLDALPLHEEVRYIHVGRDGRDACLSAHNHFSSFSEAQLAGFDRIGAEDPAIGAPYPRPPADPAAFFRHWLSAPTIPGQGDGVPHGSFFDLELSWWRERRRENLLLVHFDDLLADLDGEMRRIAAFLGIAVDEALWPSLVAASRFEAMQAAGDALMPQMRTMLEGGTRRFFHRGASGRWRGVLSDDDLARYAAAVRDSVPPGLGAWIGGGRRRTGDPRMSED